MKKLEHHPLNNFRGLLAGSLRAYFALTFFPTISICSSTVSPKELMIASPSNPAAAFAGARPSKPISPSGPPVSANPADVRPVPRRTKQKYLGKYSPRLEVLLRELWCRELIKSMRLQTVDDNEGANHSHRGKMFQ